MKTKISINKTLVTAVPQNMELYPDFNSWGPFTDGTTKYTGSVHNKKSGFHLGYYDQVTKGGVTRLSLTIL